MSLFSFVFDKKLGKFVSIGEEIKQSDSPLEQSDPQPNNTIQQFSLKFDKEEGVWRQIIEPGGG
jgi:hypothetical protein